ncbi:LysR family transcriptional regulator [Pantoea cypripedii]|uniref:LysR family transcriptional regulator n=2 Tax=Pantoea TaxID=53335 RepID=A0A1X1EGV8_PANCY|nr:LysR family transcriptional regulator [Pantoea cypripedii]MBP2199662.1 DNA-binding transcriptional LysR family regulator [Pantoea cypripedii]ORM88063.1 LysR family transcriptional regulator [Pantoea cypripedii]
MELKDLHYLLAVKETGHLGKAAQSLGITQPALTKCLQRLEKFYATRLILKVGRGMQLTEAGLLLCERAQKVVHMMQVTRQDLQALGAGTAGVIRLGVAATAAEFMLPMLSRDLLHKAPTARLEVTVGMNDLLQKLLRENKIDLILGFLPDGNSEFVTRPLIDDPVVIAASRRHPLANIHPTPEQLDQYSWLLPSSNVATRQWLEQRLRSGGYAPPRVQMESNTLSPLRQVIASTQLLSFLSRRLLKGEGDDAMLVEIPLPLVIMPRTFGWQFRSLSELSPASRLLVELAEKRWHW